MNESDVDYWLVIPKTENNKHLDGATASIKLSEFVDGDSAYIAKNMKLMDWNTPAIRLPEVFGND